MARQEIDVGAIPNDDSGDPLRIAMQKSNGLFDDVHRIIANSRVIYCEQTFVAPIGVTLDGSLAAPFNDLNAAIQAAIPGVSQATVIIQPGTYEFIPGTIDLPQNVSLINLNALGSVLLDTSIISSNTETTISGISQSVDFSMSIGDDQSADVENLNIKDCELLGTGQYRAGSTGTDFFDFKTTTFGSPSQRTVRFNGRGHSIVDCRFVGQCDLRLGSSTATLVPATDIRLDSSLIACGSFIIQAEPGKVTTVGITACLFIIPIQLQPGTGTINIVMDAISFGRALTAGTDFDVPGVTVNIIGSADFLFNDTLINSDIDDGAFQDVCEIDLSSPTFQTGLYMLTISLIWTKGDTGTAFEWQITGGAQTGVLQKQSVAGTDTETWTLSLPVVVPEIATDITLEARTTGGNNATIIQVSITLEQRQDF